MKLSEQIAQEYLELKKPTVIVHLSGKYSLLARKINNILLKKAYNKIQEQNIHEISIKELKEAIGLKTSSKDFKNYESIKEALRSLRKNDIEMNIFGKDKKNQDIEKWKNTSLLSFVEIEYRTGICRYEYPSVIRDLIKNRSIYARIDLLVQREFKSRNAQVIWEFLIEYISTSQNTHTTVVTKEIDINLFRKLLGLEEHQYNQFKDFNRYVLNTSIKEINKVSNINVEVNFIKEHRKVVSLQFTIKKCKSYQQSLPSLSSVEVEGDIDKYENTDLLITLTKEFCFSTVAAQNLLKKYEAEVIERNIKYVKERMKTVEILNISSYLISALKSDYGLHTKITEQSTNNNKGDKDHLIKQRKHLEVKIEKLKKQFTEEIEKEKERLFEAKTVEEKEKYINLIKKEYYNSVYTDQTYKILAISKYAVAPAEQEEFESELYDNYKDKEMIESLEKELGNIKE